MSMACALAAVKKSVFRSKNEKKVCSRFSIPSCCWAMAKSTPSNRSSDMMIILYRTVEMDVGDGVETEVKLSTARGAVGAGNSRFYQTLF